MWECGHFKGGSTMNAAVSWLRAAGFDTFLLSNRLPVLISGVYWSDTYNVRGWRNCASFSRKLVSAHVLRNILEAYPRFAAPINRSLFPHAYDRDPAHTLFNPLSAC